MLQTNPDAYKGASVNIVGKVFESPQQDTRGTYWQMWADPQNDDWNTVVAFADPTFHLSDNDYVHVVGAVKGAYQGKNAFGGDVTAVQVVAQHAMVTNALAAAPPANHVATVGLMQTQNGVSIRLKKVEYASAETRAFVSVSNSSNSTAHFYDFDTKAVQGSHEYSAQSGSDYPAVESDILVGVTSSGVVVLPAMDYRQPTRWVFQASSDDFSANFTPYQFGVGNGHAGFTASTGGLSRTAVHLALVKSNKAWRASMDCACDHGLEAAKSGPDLKHNLTTVSQLRIKGQNWEVQPITFNVDWIKMDSTTAAEAQVTKNETSRIYSGSTLMQTCSGPYQVHYYLRDAGGVWKVDGTSVVGGGQTCR